MRGRDTIRTLPTCHSTGNVCYFLLTSDAKETLGSIPTRERHPAVVYETRRKNDLKYCKGEKTTCNAYGQRNSRKRYQALGGERIVQPKRWSGKEETRKKLGYLMFKISYKTEARFEMASPGQLFPMTRCPLLLQRAPDASLRPGRTAPTSLKPAGIT